MLAELVCIGNVRTQQKKTIYLYTVYSTFRLSILFARRIETCLHLF